MHQRTDAELVAEVLAGNTEAFAALVRRYQDAYFRFATRVLGDRDDADDAMQSAFVRAFRQLRSCRDPSRFGAWLRQIVVNECRTFAARRDRRERRMVRDAHDGLALASETASVGADGLAEVQRALDALDADQREAFVLKHVEDLSYEEMAELTGAGVSALKMRVKRAVERLRELLQQTGSAT